MVGLLTERRVVLDAPAVMVVGVVEVVVVAGTHGRVE